MYRLKPESNIIGNCTFWWSRLPPAKYRDRFHNEPNYQKWFENLPKDKGISAISHNYNLFDIVPIPMDTIVDINDSFILENEWIRIHYGLSQDKIHPQNTSFCSIGKGYFKAGGWFPFCLLEKV